MKAILAITLCVAFFVCASHAVHLGQGIVGGGVVGGGVVGGVGVIGGHRGVIGGGVVGGGIVGGVGGIGGRGHPWYPRYPRYQHNYNIGGVPITSSLPIRHHHQVVPHVDETGLHNDVITRDVHNPFPLQHQG